MSGSPSPLNGVLLPREARSSSCPPAQELASSHLEPGLVRCVQRKDRRRGASSCCRPLFPWGVQVSPDPGAAAWTQCRPQAPVMFAAVRADARERLCPQEERQEAHRPTGRRAALCLLSEMLLQGPGVAGLAEGVSLGASRTLTPTVHGARASARSSSALGLHAPDKRALSSTVDAGHPCVPRDGGTSLRLACIPVVGDGFNQG